jgi:hypothetical protein
MSNTLLLIGASGSGKSTATRTLDPKSTFIISVLDKPLPFKGYKKHYKRITGWDDKENNYLATDDWQRIIKCITMVNKLRPEITTLVIDDLQYVLANEYMRRANENGFNKYSELANHYWQIITLAGNCRADLLTVFISHNEIDQTGKSKVKTIGKLLDEKITIEGLFTTVLHSVVNDGQFQFMTQSDGFLTAKSPIDMFDSQLIDNDLLYVKKQMEFYFNDDEG